MPGARAGQRGRVNGRRVCVAWLYPRARIMASVACTDQAACAPVPLRRSGDVTSLILSVAASVGAAVIISFVFAPRLAARAKRIQVSHDARDEFQRRTLGIY